ncbi:cyclic AMP-dependent transcription factor ATF-4 [Pseudorasbora parva]|uniref:cyclic AMP-dependent transcription factor ATF-4 n=1 Tax=Pseudorasbora parva TaxID=51549 RepID=UPI00351DCF79
MDPQMCLQDMGALLLGPSALMADPFGPLLDDEDEERALSSSSSSLSPLSPSPPASLGCKSELLLPWLPASQLIGVQTEQSTGESFSDMDWMSEKLDLNDFDLDSLIGSCDSDEPPSSPEDLLACLDTDMNLDLPFCSSELGLDLDLPLPEIPPESPPEIKSEPLSPESTNMLELGSEVSVSPRIVLSLSPSHIVLVLAPKEETNVADDSSDCDSGISVSGSPTRHPTPNPAGSSRTKPYSRPDPDAPRKSAPKVVEKKLKKMEQNKTAATRYRQKKRAEQDVLNSECAVLEKKNRELEEKAQSLSREIKYLRDLMEEVRNRRSKAKVQDA